MLVGCGMGQGEQAGVAAASLTVDQSRVLGFEAPAQDWTATNGAAVTSSATVTQGTAALAIVPSGYTEILSRPIAAPGNARTTATFDLRLPQSLSWGEVRLVVRVPSQGQHWRDLGGSSLAGRAAGVFQTLSFGIPEDLRAALGSSATDVDFRIVLNVPGGSGEYVLDNLVVSDDAPPGGGTGGGANDASDLELSFVVPRGLSVADVMISATDGVTIDDRCTLAEPAAPSEVANLGSSVLELGAGVQAFTNIASVGNVTLRSQAHVYGRLMTAGTVTQQDNVRVDGGVTTGASLAGAVTTWTVPFPAGVTQDFSLPPDAPNVVLAPSALDAVQIFSRATVTLRSGTYYLNSFVVEPEAHVRIDASSGPVLVYVRDNLHLNARLEYVGGERGQVLFGYLGTQSAYFEEAIVASVVAPRGTIDLRRPNSGAPHEGTFLGRAVHVASNATVLHLPLDWAFLCPQGDQDGDGVFACQEACDHDPNKSEPGLCGCGVSEADSDGDGMPDCKDECDFDADDTHRGQCGCAGEPGVAPAGTPCTDGLADGTFVCDGAGTCGNPQDASPEAGCRYTTLGTHAYWFCPAATAADAAARCNASEPGARLVQIDTALEDFLVAAFIDAPSLIGATDRTTEGEWTWQYTATLDAKKLWTGGPAGESFRGRYSSFVGGAPAEGGDCAIIDASGSWTVVGCDESHPYVCERPFGSSWNPGDGRTHDPLGPEDAYPNWTETNGAGNGSQIPLDDCIDRDPGVKEPRPEYGNLLLSDDTVEVYDCDQECQDGSTRTEEECRTLCAGAATPPPAGSSGRCTPSRPLQQLAVVAPGTCAVDDENTPENEADCSDVSILAGVKLYCGVKTQCFAMQKASNGVWAPRKCAEGCASGHTCDTASGNCVNPELAHVCEPATKDGVNCVGQCFNTVGCGIPVAIEDGGYVEQDLICDETRFCPEAGVYAGPLNGPNLDTREALDESQLPDESTVAPPAYATDFSDPCAGGACAASCATNADPSCDRGARHPWCNLDATLPSGAAATNADVRDTREGDRGDDSSLIKFDVDPSADLDFDIEPLPFGLARFDLAAAAAIRSVATFDFAGISGDVEIVDLRGQLTAALCRVSTADSKMEILGADFLPSLAGDLKFDTATDFPDVTAQCEEAVATYVDTVDRAKKALRDVQELIRQYDQLKASGQTFSPSFCRTVAGTGLRPPGMPGADLADPCADETPVETINAFITYYESQVDLISGARQALASSVLNSQTLASVLGLDGDAVANNGFDFYTSFGDILKGEQTATLLTVNFFIGPIPCNLEVSSYMHYGIEGGLGVNLWPQALVDGTGDFARAGAIIMPYADSGVTLFVGAGFDAGPLSLKVGLEGSITLANIQLPATASAGLAVNPQRVAPEERPLPADLAALTDGSVRFPTNGIGRYDFQFVYSYGVDMTLSDILSGHLDGSVVVKFFFFKKRWSQQLVAFEGLPQIGPFNLIGGGSPAPSEWPDEPVAEDTKTWTSGYDSVPFVSIQRLTEPAEALSAVGTFDSSRAAQLFYDSLCTCQEPAEECNRQADCCDSTQACFSDPALGGGTKVCSACRRVEPVTDANPAGLNESCNNDLDCCAGNYCSQTGKVRTNCRLKCSDAAYLSVWQNTLRCKCGVDPIFTWLHAAECDALDDGGIVISLPGDDYLCDEVDPPYGVCVPEVVSPPIE